jgi:hypothetical protein
MKETIIVENLYLALSISAYETVPVKEVVDPETGITTQYTLKDIFPNPRNYFPLIGKCGVGVEVQGQEIPQLIALCGQIGFSVTWGAADGYDVEIMGLTPFKTRMAEFSQREAEAYALANPEEEMT